MMNVNQLLQLLNEEFPFSKAESWDNVGLLIGDKEDKINKILITLDATLEVVEEAVANEVNVIVAHHPLIFSGIKSINAEGYSQVMRMLIKHDINLIAMHTNLDAHPHGVSAMIGEKVGLRNMEILIKQSVDRNKLQVFVPKTHVESLKKQLALSGAGNIGDYSECFYQVEGLGQFKPNDNANPYIGEKGQVEQVEEIKLECVFEPKYRSAIERAIQKYHPYEEPAYDITTFNVTDDFGTGIKGKLAQPVLLRDWLPKVKEKLEIDSVKLIGDSEKTIQTVGIIGGAGVSYMQDVMKANVDIFLTGDIKYHEAHDLLMADQTTLDIQHYSEHVMKNGLKQMLSSLIDVPVIESSVNTNPFQVY